MEEYTLLHCYNLLSRVRIICQIDEVFHCGRVDLFVLRRNEKRGYSYKLNICLHYDEPCKVSVDQVNGKVESLWEQLELSVHADNPIYEDSPNVFIYIFLVAHVEAIRLSVLLCQLHMLLDVPAVQANVVNVT